MIQRVRDFITKCQNPERGCRSRSSHELHCSRHNHRGATEGRFIHGHASDIFCWLSYGNSGLKRNGNVNIRGVPQCFQNDRILLTAAIITTREYQEKGDMCRHSGFLYGNHEAKRWICLLLESEEGNHPWRDNIWGDDKCWQLVRDIFSEHGMLCPFLQPKSKRVRLCDSVYLPILSSKTTFSTQ